MVLIGGRLEHLPVAETLSRRSRHRGRRCERHLLRVVEAGQRRPWAGRRDLPGIKTVDTWLANPAYVVLPVTGILMVLDAGLGFTTFWILAALILFVAMGALASILFSPALRRQTDLAATGAESDGYEAAARRTTVTGLVTMVPITAILYLMVMKPTL